MTYLADTSAVWRLLRRQIGGPWPRHVAQGLVAICPPVESELMPGLRADRDYEPFFSMLGQTFGWVPSVDDPWPKIIAVQRDLVAIGHHRGPSPMDILIALTAQQHRLTLLHVDDDFASIAKVRPGIAMIRLQPADH
ncbi:PIN domain nuclease [Streptomyces roseofulvus]|uniref:Ribonuclease VapC n=2 Tax=Streptomyces TaxID=1883 RepID=A0ABU4KIJ7_9ACTN|nr:PIN domain-containing protein [Streptomyces roseolus]MDX2297618.1 VapC toxin family PIN domain ribonuclease [Streptomyces roseolus]